MWHALAIHPDVASRDLSSVRAVSCGAAPVDPGTLDNLRRAFPGARVAEEYGLTEATCVVTAVPLVADVEYRLGSVGLPVFDTEIEIRAQGDPSLVLGDGEHGELWRARPPGHRRLPGHPEITAQQYVDGWLATGDIAHRDADGFVYIADRGRARS